MTEDYPLCIDCRHYAAHSSLVEAPGIGPRGLCLSHACVRHRCRVTGWREIRSAREEREGHHDRHCGEMGLLWEKRHD